MIDPKKVKYDAHWQQIKSNYDFFSSYSCQNRFKRCVDLIAKTRPNIVLDMGCGPGYLAYLLKQNNPKSTIHGLDISKSALDKADYLDKKFELDIDKENVPQPDNYYDVIVCTEFLEHLYNVMHALTEMYRLLKKSGIGIISVPNYSFWRFRIDSLLGKIPWTTLNGEHIQLFNTDLLKKKVKEVGFNVNAICGLRRRCLFLCSISNSLFSEWLIFEVSKP